jgi:hypothetical protein
MRIPLRVRRLFPSVDRFFPLVDVIIRHREVIVRTEALIDTGSFRTTIAPRDVERMRTVRVEALPPSSPRYSRIGGFVIPTYSLENVRLTFWDEAKVPVRIEISAIDVLGFSTRDVDAIKHLPTIIGTDFLEDQKFALYFDPSGKTAYLEKV